jgi:anti-sigma28 factor (negative regulator of flagellin synthesis)
MTMKINNTGGANSPNPIRQDRAKEAQGAYAPRSDAGSKAASSALERIDRVEISAQGRARTAELQPVAPDATGRLAEIRRRILEGAYDADTLVDQVAQRIIQRGDL